MPPRIILVEDDLELQSSLLEYLKLTGLNAVGAESAIKFYQLLNAGEFDIAIVDIGLPDQSGFEIAQYLRQNSNIGIIILTAKGSTEDRIQGYNSGCDLYFVKPVDCQELTAAIQSLYDRLNSKTEFRSEQNSAAWFLDATNWTMTPPAGKPFTLTGKELQFLSLLIDNNGNPVDRNELMLALGYDVNQYENRALDALVRRLRKKLAEADGDNKDPIKTIHAVGYCFSAPAQIKQTSP